MSFEREREMFTATCGDCGNECQIPFKPKEDRPVYCRECFQNHRPANRGNSRFGRRDRGSRFRDDRPREMHTATCGDCGNECQIPFKPKEDRPVYCKECFANHRR
ncbi:MAG: CxxC-x17-CxxC domain-containing protein [Nitrosopumilaceae archaeon]